MKHVLATSAVALLLATGLATAAEQTTGQADKPQTPVQSQEMKPDAGGDTRAQSAGSIDFVTSQAESDWLASSLLNRKVKDAGGETLGHINDVVLDQDGRVGSVLIGVGGFLGIGEKVVGVRYDALEFKEREVKRPAGTDVRKDALRQSTRPPSASGGDPGRMAERRPQGNTPIPRKDADHSDMVIVLNVTAKQLESAPAYMKIGETKAAGSASGTEANREAGKDRPKKQ